MSVKIALAGNPNSGKTTLFNKLTGSNQYTGNWPGVTVDKKVGRYKRDKNIVITDLPGVYSLSPYTPEEIVARDYLLGEDSAVIINLADAMNLERNLYLTTQLSELGKPMVITLNMIDIMQKKGESINIKKLAGLFGCPVIEMSALKGTGLIETIDTALMLAKENPIKKKYIKFSSVTENALSEISALIKDTVPSDKNRWYSIKIFERDMKAVEKAGISDEIIKKSESIILYAEKLLGKDAISIISDERYDFINKAVSICCSKNKKAVSTSEKIDRVITNRWLALPVFAVVITIIYYVSVNLAGKAVSEWIADIMFKKIIIRNLSAWLEYFNTAGWLRGLLIQGIIKGVSSVISFVPQMLTLFFFLSVLEDCGYMARVAFIMDRIFRKFGLSGKSFIPLLVCTGCSVPGIMATKMIENENDRRITVITAPFIPCGAKLTVVALIGGVLFPELWFFAPAVFFLGILAVAVSGIILKKTRLFSGDKSPFLLELPDYHMPSIKSVLPQVIQRVKAFVFKAGTVIFIASGLIWFLSSFGFVGEICEVGCGESLLATIGSIITPLFKPIGFGFWEAAVASISGLLAKENIVATLSILLGINDIGESSSDTWLLLKQLFGSASAASFLVFNMLCGPCVSTISAIKKELLSIKLTCFAITYQTVLAYAFALVTYQTVGLITGELRYGTGSVIAVVVLSVFFYFLFRPERICKKKR